MNVEKKRILVDMSATILHHGHIRLLKKASKLGVVVVTLTRDKDIKYSKGYFPELNYNQRKEILCSIRYVDEVIPSPWLIKSSFLKKHNIDFLIHGNDNVNDIDKSKLIIFKRTRGISSSLIRKKSINIIENDIIDRN